MNPIFPCTISTKVETMNICMISKYPPIQGGVSARTYWLAKGFAERGVETHVVTNANCVEKEYLIQDAHSGTSPNLHIHFIEPEIPWHIPDSKLYVPRLLDKTLQVIRENKIDLIDTGYLIPYGIVGYLLSTMTGIPYTLRHGGSDLEKFLRKRIFSDLLEMVIKSASAIITDHKNKETFQYLNSRIHIVHRYIPDERYFKPSFLLHEIPTFAYIGKINYYWRYKSLHRIGEVFSGVGEKHRLVFIGQGKGVEDFKLFISQFGLSNYEFRPFVHPVNMPDLLSEIDFLIYFTKDTPIKDFSNILVEALWSGVGVITDDTIDLSSYTEAIELDSEDQIIRLPMDDVKDTQAKIAEMIKDWKKPQKYLNNKIKYNFKKYVNTNLKVYEKIGV